MTRRIAGGLCAAAFAVLVSSLAWGLEIRLPVSADLAADGWKTLTFSGIPPTTFTGDADGVISVRADHSSSVLYRAAAPEPVAAETLSWSWRVLAPVPATDLTKTDGDDRSLSVYVVFRGGGLMSRMLSAVSPFSGGRVLTYVWGGGAVDNFENPHLPGQGWIFVRRTAAAETGVWLDERADLAADYRAAFGTAPPPVAAIGISSDSDDVGMIAAGAVRGFVLR